MSNRLSRSGGLTPVILSWRNLIPSGRQQGVRVRAGATHRREAVAGSGSLSLLKYTLEISLVDLIPDFIPAVGHLDDAVLVPLCIWLAIQLIPASLLEQHWQRAKVYAEQPRHWRVGMVFVAIWAIALTFALRWLIKAFTQVGR